MELLRQLLVLVMLATPALAGRRGGFFVLLITDYWWVNWWWVLLLLVCCFYHLIKIKEAMQRTQPNPGEFPMVATNTQPDGPPPASDVGEAQNPYGTTVNHV